MTKIQVKKITEYWQKTAEHDYKTMQWLLKGKRYSDALFYGHIILEKILKGLVVKETKKESPYIHDLIRLKDMAGLDLPAEIDKFLNRMNDFNIRARYPEYKLRFYRQYSQKKNSQPYINQIINLYI